MDWRQAANQKLKDMPDEAKELRKQAIADFRVFARLVNPGYMYGDIHMDLAKWMMDYSLYGSSDNISDNKLIMLPRAHLKSHLVATWCAWIIVRHPEVTILYLSATSELAETQLFAIQNILGSRVFMRYFPEYVNPQEHKREAWNSRKLTIDHIKRFEEGVRDPTIATAGLTTNTTGWHADIIVPDDLVIPENAYTEEGREGVRKKSSQFTSIRNPGGFTMACGTRYHPDDIYSSWKDQEYEVFNDDGELVDKRPVWSIREHKVEEDGHFLWPRVIRDDGKSYGFDLNVLSRIKAEYEDSVQFYAQYYNDPNSVGSNRINRSCFQYIEPDQLKRQNGRFYIHGKPINTYAAVDFAFSLKKGRDYTAIVVVGIDTEGFIYVLDIRRFRTDKISVIYDHIAELHEHWSFRRIRAEVTVAQSMIVNDLKDKIRLNGRALSVEEFRPNRNMGSKEDRIAAVLEPRYRNLTIYHIKGGYTTALEEEVILARPKHDDIKDAFASAVEIAKPPVRTNDMVKKKNVVYSRRFGGVSFK